MPVGGGGSFEDFVAAHYVSLLSVARSLLSDVGLGEDLLQEALLRTERHWRRAKVAPVAYVRRVLVNLSYDHGRALRRRPREVPWDEHRESWASVADFAGAVVDRETLRRACEELPERQRAVVLLRFFADLSVEQTAEALSCGVGTVKSHTSRAIAALRIVLASAVVMDTAVEAHRSAEALAARTADGS